MIRTLNGRISMSFDGGVVLDVNGVGFEVYCADSSNLYSKVGEKVCVFTAMLVREDDISLYGFETIEDLKVFRMLMTVNGIGAKASLAILSALSLEEIITAIYRKEYKPFTRANGVGPKTAQRIPLELHDKVADQPDLFGFVTSEETEAKSKTTLTNPSVQNAIHALTGLGLSKTEAEEAANAVATETMNTEEIILEALRRSK